MARNVRTTAIHESLSFRIGHFGANFLIKHCFPSYLGKVFCRMKFSYICGKVGITNVTYLNVVQCTIKTFSFLKLIQSPQDLDDDDIIVRQTNTT